LADPRLPFVNVIHPAAVVGNLAGESGLDPGIDEVSPLVRGSRGGHGWEQATGPRREALEEFGAARGDPNGDMDETNYEFLVSELLGSERRALDRLMQTTTLEAAVYTFEVAFERPSSTSDVNSRIRFAQQALDAVGQIPAIRTAPESPHVPAPAAAAPVPTVALGTPDALAVTYRAWQTVVAIAGYYSGPIDGRPSDAMIDAEQKYLDWLDAGARP
jgi:hypothetical protein